MISPGANTPFVAIACGGTAGHLFPGLAVAEQLQKRGCAVALLISPKDVDQEAVKSVRGMEIFTLPAVGLQNRNYISFAGSFVKSLFAARKIFRKRLPAAVLAMGGFTSASPIWVGKDFGAKTFLHESNTIPGRANRFLARFVDEAFVGFPSAAVRLRARKVTTTGTPVRAGFVAAGVSPAVEPGILPGGPGLEIAQSSKQSALNPGGRMPPSTAGETPAATCRTMLGLDLNRPTILVMGGSQGASGINDMILSALPSLGNRAAAWQWLHLTGPNDAEKVKQAYAARGFKAVVKPFLAEMDLALGAATVAVSRAGASSLAEIAAMRLPSLLVPFPAATDNHQLSNAQAFETTGAARLLEQKNATQAKVAALLCELVEDPAARAKIQTALAQWHSPKAAEQIAESILSACWSSSFSLPAKDSLKAELQQTRGQGGPRSDAVERENFSAA
jgi:UDP-N-acetylglucosamine--N-acetylmuramyl-(pentapeptide) pyrophosphoryl-undecaprenol N-acetylglucosamine transferase